MADDTKDTHTSAGAKALREDTDAAAVVAFQQECAGLYLFPIVCLLVL